MAGGEFGAPCLSVVFEMAGLPLGQRYPTRVARPAHVPLGNQETLFRSGRLLGRLLTAGRDVSVGIISCVRKIGGFEVALVWGGRVGADVRGVAI